MLIFENIAPPSQTSPEQIDYIRKWGLERAVPAGKSFEETDISTTAVERRKTPRTVIV